MPELTIHSRRSWGARAPRKGLTDQPKGKIAELFIHHVGDEPMRSVVTSVAEERQQVRAIQEYHMETHGWLDIGYSLILCPPWGRPGHAGNVYAGRALSAVPAAQLDHNRGTWALLVMAGGDDPVSDELVHRIQAIARWCARQAGHHLTVRPHSAVTATSCPGPHLRAAMDHIGRY